MAHLILRDEKHGILRKNTPYDRFKLLTDLYYFKWVVEKVHKDLYAIKADSAVSDNAKYSALASARFDEICDDPRMESKSCIPEDSATLKVLELERASVKSNFAKM